MKKVISIFAMTLLLTACMGSDATEPSDDTTSELPEITMTQLDDDLFITLSAQILCLPDNNPEATADQIETMAKQIIADAGVAESDFSVYQETIEADPASKQDISLSIIGKMRDLCSVVETEEESEPEVEIQSEEEDAAMDEPGAAEQNPMEAAFGTENETTDQTE